MIKIRKGNDFVMVWKVIINKGDVMLEELEDVTFELSDPNGNLCPIESEIHGEYAYIRFLGTDQKRTGSYKLTIWVNKGRRGQAVADRCEVFSLTPCSDKADLNEQTGLTICPDLSIESVNLAIGIKGDKGDAPYIVKQEFDVEGNTILTWNDGKVTVVSKGAKGDMGETPDLTELKADLRTQEILNKAQQQMIDANTEANEAQQIQIDTNTETNLAQQEKLDNEIGDEATDEDIDALFQ